MNPTQWNPLGIPFPDIEGNYCDSNISQCKGYVYAGNQYYASPIRPTTPRELTDEEIAQLELENMWFNKIKNPVFYGLMGTLFFFLVIILVLYFNLYKK